LLKAALDLTRAEAGEVALELRQVDVAELLRELDAETLHLRQARRRGGVGLGPYIARRFVEVLGGRITVDSRVVLGSIYTRIFQMSVLRR
jgi:signal transduction histidine kinase